MSERFYDLVDRVDAAVAVGDVEAAVAVLRRAGDVPSLRRHFFEKISAPSWLVPLREAGSFSDPPPFGDWPEGEFLARMAIVDPGTIVEIILTTRGTDNASVHECFVDAALAMEAALSAAIAQKEATWIQRVGQRLSLSPEKLGALISHLAKGGENDTALQLAQTVLGILPDPNPGASPKAQGYVEEWDYQQILEKNVVDLVQATPEPAFALLCDLLAAAVDLSFREARPDPPEDFSTSWRHAIEDSAQDLSPTLIQGVRGLLVTAVRDSAERAIRDQLIPIAAVVRLLEGCQWLIFQRIALHVLRRFPTGVEHIVAERLLDSDHFASPYETRLLHEYALLLREQFKHLAGEQQATILEWIDQGPDLGLVKERYEANVGSFSDELGHLYPKHWRLNRLAIIRGDLPAHWSARYDEFVRELGEPEHPDFQSYSSGVESGPTSPMTAREIGSLTVDELVARISRFHAEWKPSYSITAATPEGLGGELSAAVTESPERFAAQALRFRDLHQTYIRGFIYGLEQAARQNRGFDWAPVLDLCRWLVEHPREVSENQGAVDPLSFFTLQPGWAPARSAVASLLSSAFEGKERKLAFDLREAAWQVLEPLTDDPEPDQNYESRYLKDAGATHISINTIRGKALHAVIRYALWFRNHLKESGGEALIAQGFGAMPEVRRVLDAHLDTGSDPSFAIRSVYGQWFPWLHLLDADWALSKRSQIFPTEESSRRHWATAWSAYVIFSAAYNNVFEVLQAEYARAVELIGSAEANVERLDSAERRLAEHLALLYGRGRIPLEQPRNLIVRFFEKADDKLRAHAMETAGRILQREEGAVAQEVIERLKGLWEARLKAAEPSPAAHRAELSAYAWWFTSGKFDDEWALNQLCNVLRLIGGLQPYFSVPKRLAEITPRHPRQAVECLRLMVDGANESWEIYPWRDEARKILEEAKRSGDSAVLETVNDVVNRLGARGFFEFRDLLSQ